MLSRRRVTHVSGDRTQEQKIAKADRRVATPASAARGEVAEARRTAPMPPPRLRRPLVLLSGCFLLSCPLFTPLSPHSFSQSGGKLSFSHLNVKIKQDRVASDDFSCLLSGGSRKPKRRSPSRYLCPRVLAERRDFTGDFTTEGNVQER